VTAPLVVAAQPVTRLLAAVLVALVLVASVDPVSAGIALLLELALLPLGGVPLGQLVRRSRIVWITAPLAAVTVALYGRGEGRVYADVLLVHVTDGSLLLALATLLRILAIGVPAAGLFVAVDATGLADGLAQILRLPARFVLGALAAFRLVDLFADDWRSLALARRARGVADRGRIRALGGQTFALLVLAVRRGSDLATAMEARGFGAPVARTWTRTARLTGADAGLLASAVGALAVAVAVAVATGAWNPILAGHA
jgi:energy-coupling factor transport system permease protein